jgi:tetratricopeptide (TPR) repeat protein
MAHYMVGEEGPARVALQKAADASTDFPGKEEARQRLALLAIDVSTANASVRTELENYLRGRPNDPAALVRLADVQRRDSAVDQAVKTYERVIAENPLFGPATRQLVLLYVEHPTDTSRAYELALKARQSYPEDVEILKALGILSYQRDLFPRSAELLKEAAVKRKDDPELLYYLGQAYRQLRQWGDCKAILERAKALDLSQALVDQTNRALADCSENIPQ